MLSEIVVAKFGGSSLADSNQFKKVKDIVFSNKKRKYIVPSAPGKRYKDDEKITDLLFQCYNSIENKEKFIETFKIIEDRYIQICNELELDLDISSYCEEIKNTVYQNKSLDYIVSRGEYLNAIVLAAYLGFKFVDAAEVIVFLEDGKLNFDETQSRLYKMSLEYDYAVIPGFYGATDKGIVKVFSRGGSDFSGSLVANGVNASLYENWADVSGFLKADPRIVDHPRHIEKITYKELRELSYMGASVLHEDAVFPVKKSKIPIQIRNTNSPMDEGTLILSDFESPKYPKTITGIAGKKDFTVIAIEKMLMNEEKGFLRKLLSIIEDNDISVEHIPSGIDSVSLIISDEELRNKLDKVIEEIRTKLNPDSVEVYPNMALMAVVGKGMIRTRGISARLFTALKEQQINVRMISQGSSEINIIIGIENEDFESAVNAVYYAFEQANI